GILPGDERGPPGRTRGLAVVVREADALHADAIDVRRPVAHHAQAVRADVLPADVVAPDDENVRRLRLGGGRERNEQHAGRGTGRKNAVHEPSWSGEFTAARTGPACPSG